MELEYPKDRYKIIVIDNNSCDGTVAYIHATYPFVRVLENKENIGFGRANNIGIKHTSPEATYIALLNQDSLVDSHWLFELVEPMEKNPTAGACGATQKNYEDYGKKISGEKHLKNCLWMGCGSIIFRKKALQEIEQQGWFFDPFYFMYVEDIDITWRLKIAGWDILHTFNALWFHDGRKRPMSYDNPRLFWSWKNRLYLLFKFGSWKQIAHSLQNYALLFLITKKNNKEHEQKNSVSSVIEAIEIPLAEKIEKRGNFSLQKIYFLVKLSSVFWYTIACALFQGRKLRKKFLLNQEEIDQFVQYIDRVFFRLEK